MKLKINQLLNDLHVSAKHILEIGSSAGIHTKYFSGHVTVIDLDENKLSRSAECNNTIATIKHDLTLLPLPFDKKFDCVLCLEVIEHLNLAQAIELISELERITEGTLIFSTPNVNNFTQLIRFFITRELPFYNSYTLFEKIIYTLTNLKIPSMEDLRHEFCERHDTHPKDIGMHRSSFDTSFFKQRGYTTYGTISEFSADLIKNEFILKCCAKLVDSVPSISGTVIAVKNIHAT